MPTDPDDGITLNGRQSKVIVTDYSFGKRSKLLFSTAGILFAGTIGNKDVLLLYSDLDQEANFALDTTTVSVKPNSLIAGLHSFAQTDDVASSRLVFLADTQTASTFWAPVVSTKGKFGSYFQIGTNTTVLVGGPYLVRNATISSPGHLALRGDLNASTPLTLIVPDEVRTVSWNGESVKVAPVANQPGVLQGHLSLKANVHSIKIPALTKWKFKDSLPEIQSAFDDSAWTTADHRTTNITAPLFGDGRVLYGASSSLTHAVEG